MPKASLAAALARTAVCALTLCLASAAAAQSLYDDPRPKKQFPPTLTPPAAAPVEMISFGPGACSASTRMDCAPKSIARERDVAPFVQRKPEPAAK